MSNYESFSGNTQNNAKSKDNLIQRFFTKIGKRDASSDILERSESNTVIQDNEMDYSSTSSSIETSRNHLYPAPIVQKRPSLQYNNRVTNNDRKDVSRDHYRNNVFADRSKIMRSQQDLSLRKLLYTVKSNISFNIRGSMDHLNVNSKLNKVYWMPDSICLSCYSCDDEFTTIRRRHHCRMCGQIFCYRCCSYELPGELWSLNKAQRSCRLCFLSFYDSNVSVKKSSVTSHSGGITHDDQLVGHDHDAATRTLSTASGPPDAPLAADETKGLSFSSHDLHILGQDPLMDPNTQEYLTETSSTASFIELINGTTQAKSSSSTTLTRTNSLPKISDLNNMFPSNSPSFAHNAVTRKLSYTRVFSRVFHTNHNSSGGAIGSFSTTADQIDEYQSTTTPAYKRHLINVWLEIIRQKVFMQSRYSRLIRIQRQTRVINAQFSFPDDDMEDLPCGGDGAVGDLSSDATATAACTDGEEDHMKIDKDHMLPIIFKDSETNLACINGSALIDWMVKYPNLGIKDRQQARRICQSYLEMQLLTPYFHHDVVPYSASGRSEVTGDGQGGTLSFKDNATIYVIREFTTECNSPCWQNIDQQGEQFFSDTTDTYLTSSRGNSVLLRSTGNSVFYNDPNADPSQTIDKVKLELDNSISKLRGQYSLNLSSLPLSSNSIQLANIDKYNSIWLRSCEYLERLLKQELREYNVDMKWANILLPICKKLAEAISFDSKQGIGTYSKNYNDIRRYVQIKKIADNIQPDCSIIHGVCLSTNWNLAPPTNHMREQKSVLLIRSNIDYFKQKKLVSIEPLLLQEDEYLRNCVKKICRLRPDVVVVEGTVSSKACELLEKFGVALVANVRREQIDRLSRMLRATIVDSVDSLGASNIDQQLGKCASVSLKTHRQVNGRTKHIMVFHHSSSIAPAALQSATVLLRSSSLSELVRVKYIIKYFLVAFKNAALELSLFKDFQLRSLNNNISPASPKALSTSTHINECEQSVLLDIIRNKLVAISVNVEYTAPSNIYRSVYEPQLQDRLLALDLMNLSSSDRINEMLKRKYRHVLAERYDEVRMQTRRHPLMYEPIEHALIQGRPQPSNGLSKCLFYADYRVRGARYCRPLFPSNGCDPASSVTSLDFNDQSDIALQTGVLTRAQQINFRTKEKAAFDSIRDMFNPRNFQRILLLYSIHTPSAVCESPRKISLSYYESTDRSLGAFVKAMLNDFTSCPSKCEASIFKHTYRFVHNTGCLQMSVLQMEPEISTTNGTSSNQRTGLSTTTATSNNQRIGNDSDSGIMMWSWCSRCDNTLGAKLMSEDSYHLSLGRFMDLLFNLSNEITGLIPGQCNHSLQENIRYYFAQNNAKALEIKYTSVNVYEFQTPDLVIDMEPRESNYETKFAGFKEINKEINKLREIKFKCNVEIKDKIYAIRNSSKVEDCDLRDFLSQESNSEQYTNEMERIYNMMEDIYVAKTNSFDGELYDRHEIELKDAIIILWQDIMCTLVKWDARLHEAYEKEEKPNEKRQSKHSELKTGMKTLVDNIQNDSSSSLADNLSNLPLLSKSFSCAPADVFIPAQDLTPQAPSTALPMVIHQHFNFYITPDPEPQEDPTTEDVSAATHVQLLKSHSFEMLSCPDISAPTETQQLNVSSAGATLSGASASAPGTDHSMDSKVSSADNIDELDGSTSKRDKQHKTESSSDKSSTMQPLKKFFTNLFTSGGLKILEDRSGATDSFIFQDIQCETVPVAVTDESLTSVVAFALGSNVYQDHLRDMMELHKSNNVAKPVDRTASPLYKPAKQTHQSSVPNNEDVTVTSFVPESLLIDNHNPTSNNNLYVDPDSLKKSIKDCREISVKYINRKDTAEDISDVENMSEDDNLTKYNEEIKFELSEEIHATNETPSVLTQDTNQSNYGLKVTNPPTKTSATIKKVSKQDIELDLVNHKVRCTCKVYYAREFYELRRRALKFSEEIFIRSLAESRGWATTGGRSGLKFQKTLDNRFVIKQLNQSEWNGFRRFYSKYFQYIEEKLDKNEKCVLAKILGIYHVDYINSTTKYSYKMDFLVMENLLYNHKSVGRVFDLKGKRHAVNDQSACTDEGPQDPVLQDKEFMSYVTSRPIYVSWQAQIALKETLSRDSVFLSTLPVMDYSLLLVVDDSRRVLSIGVIDYLRMFTVDKLIEMHLKKKLLNPVVNHGEQPTVIQPQKYQQRFQQTIIEQYFLVSPSPWDSILIGPSQQSSATPQTSRPANK